MGCLAFDDVFDPLYGFGEKLLYRQSIGAPALALAAVDVGPQLLTSRQQPLSGVRREVVVGYHHGREDPRLDHLDGDVRVVAGEANVVYPALLLRLFHGLEGPARCPHPVPLLLGLDVMVPPKDRK